MNFEQFTQQFFQFLGNGKTAEATEYLYEHGNQHTFHEEVYTWRYWLTCLLAQTGQIEAAVTQLHIAWTEGIWYSRIQLTENAELESLRGHEQFNALLQASTQMQIKLRETQAIPERYTQHGQDIFPTAPLFLGLHGNHSNYHEIVTYWDQLIDEGYVLSAVQSSQFCSIPVYEWDSMYKAEDELKAHYEALCQEFPMHGSVQIGGHTRGAAVAFQIALAQIVPATSCLLVAPTLSKLSDLEEMITQERASPLRCMILIDPNDPHYPCLQEIIPLFADNHIDCTVHEISGMGTGYPADFTTYLTKFAQN